MGRLRAALEEAAQRGLLNPERISDLEVYLNTRMNSGKGEQGLEGKGSAPPDTEVPRFIRGFHDVLISLGVFILLVGLGGAGSIFATAPAIIMLAEILVRRQRLALPAVLLSVATAVWAVVTSAVILDEIYPDAPYLALVLKTVPIMVVLGAFAWRYRVPLAVAQFLASCLVLVFTLLFWGVAALTTSSNILKDHPLIAVGLLVIGAVSMFGLAMRYDLSDRERLTRRADIAFWLHLMTAPALLYAAISVVLVLYRKDVAGLDISDTALAPPIIGIVAVLMLTGLVIDRRAFATSGLVALIVAVIKVLQTTDMTGDVVLFLALTTVGLIVLLVGTGWRYLRRQIMELLPRAWQAKLPPVM
ncbi:hypothetical protein [Rhizobium oryzicola]|uniref:DUF2157 domain-containing protein n=1 Tax=Rhizobium oryzicola TaxID=1232668 RepID=A0ABT8SVF1_9HYPH|nr:hypothetical protein [Rhizobium oryzicola]MDO1582326.1 hypothetical protein [Rhizobium oryzicola]